MALADVLASPANNTKHGTIVKHYKRAHDKLGTRWLPRQQQQASPVRFLLPAHRWSGVSDVLREVSLICHQYVWHSSAFVWRLLFRKIEAFRHLNPGVTGTGSPEVPSFEYI
jgi:hypothetical protein